MFISLLPSVLFIDLKIIAYFN